jgi:hypothetical protein
MKLCLDGGIWPQVVVVQVNATDMLIEAPAEPALHVGHTADVTFDGRKGIAVISAVYRSVANPKVHYGVRIIEHDPGLVAGATRACTPEREECVRVNRRSLGTPPAPRPDADVDGQVVAALRRALTLSLSSLTLSEGAAVLIVERALKCDSVRAHQLLTRLVDKGDVIRIDRQSDDVRYGLPVR